MEANFRYLINPTRFVIPFHSNFLSKYSYIKQDPNAEDPLNHEAATKMLQSMPNFKSIVRKTLKG